MRRQPQRITGWHGMASRSASELTERDRVDRQPLLRGVLLRDGEVVCDSDSTTRALAKQGRHGWFACVALSIRSVGQRNNGGKRTGSIEMANAISGVAGIMRRAVCKESRARSGKREHASVVY
eukprot:4273671-Pleurochrysis_carterae.AAC.1